MPAIEVKMSRARGTGGYRQVTFEASDGVMEDLVVCPVCDGSVLTVATLVGETGEVPLATGVCLGCGLLMHRRRPSAAWFDWFYRSIYGQGADVRNCRPVPDRQMLDLLGQSVPPGGSVLDVGCGTGSILLPFQEAGFRVLGSEPCRHRAEAARAAGLPVTDAPLERLPEDPTVMDAGPFDLVILRQVLEHLLDPMAALRAVRRVLSPNGSVFISVPNLWRQRTFKAMHYLPHVYNFGPGSLREALRRVGLAVHACPPDRLLQILASPASEPLPVFRERTLEVLAWCLAGWGVPNDPAALGEGDHTVRCSIRLITGTWEAAWTMPAARNDSVRAAAEWLAAGARTPPPDVFPVRVSYPLPRAQVWTT